jgi:D-glycero-D-manno-heptose 1,7-bisphosphate phosphatase
MSTQASTSPPADLNDAGILAPGVFIDRDGTIIEDTDYPSDPDSVILLPEAAEAIARLNAAGLTVIGVTNQSGIARGYFGEDEYRKVASRVDELLKQGGASVDAWYYCPHGPDTSPPCTCRKPLPGMFEQGAREHGLDLSRSYFIGDRSRDLIAGVAAGGTGYLIEGPHTATDTKIPEEVVRVESLYRAVELILSAEVSD